MGLVDDSFDPPSGMDEPGVQRTDDTLYVTTPLGDAGKNRVEEMLRERNFDPDGWLIVQLTVNERENASGRMLQQTRAVLKRIVPIEETPLGQILTFQVNNARKPAKRLPPLTSFPTVTVLFGDDHAPHHDPLLHELTCEMLADVKPDRIIHMGDGVDFDSISRHTKRPTEFTSTPQQGVNTLYQLLSEKMDAAGHPEAYYLPGNHDIRVEKALLDRLPDIYGLTRPGETEAILSMGNILRLNELGIEYVSHAFGDYPHGTVVLSGDLVATHGWVARKGAGSSARALMEQLDSGVIIGHTHRLAVTHKTRWGADGEPTTYTLGETGTMAKPYGLQYTRAPDWQQGFLTVTVWPHGGHQTDIVTYRDGALRWQGREWRSTSRGLRVS